MVFVWGAHAEINRLVEGTELASMISQAAPSQREGVRASLNLIADALRLLKTKEEAKANWTAREWATKRRGWIFLTSTPEPRAPLQPLLSLWLDLLVLRLMNQETGPAHPVWFVLDELASEADYLRDGIHELRVSLSGVHHRILYFFHRASAAVVSARACERARGPSRQRASIDQSCRYPEDRLRAWAVA